ncbi:MAG: LlaJI family restriction endonuclease [Melioribacteraceae bacterium]|nr:LlaJI family restriction endonuclease [Melioribacteraceae bacterium]
MRHKSNYIVAIEYKEYDNDYSTDLVNQLVYNEVCSVKRNKIRFKVTGILIYKNTFIIVFPKGYKAPEAQIDIQEHAHILVQVLLKYRRETGISPEEMEMLGGNEGQYNENLYTAYLIITDFIQNGHLKKAVGIKSSVPSGNIDWTATINKRQPIFSGKSVIYTDAISRKTISNRNHLLTKLHSYCVYQSVEKYGWLFGLSLANMDLDIQEMPCDISYAINVLARELNSTFVEREIIVIKMVTEFLSGIELETYEEKLDIMVTPFFHNVWEAICGNNFNNQYRMLKPIIPKLNWEITSAARVQSQRPDIMILREEKLYILDAKYYDIDANLPGWPDVVKQLFYAFTIFRNIKSENFTLTDKKLNQQIKKIKTVENAFLFPSAASEGIKYIGKVNVEGNKDLNDITAYKINTFLAMKCYIGKEKYSFFNQIMNSKS